MSAHQVVIGALNPSENCFSIGAVEGLNFIACAVGADVVILASNFERIQVIPGSAYKREEIVNSVNCCVDSGKVSVCYGKTIRILEPVLHNGKPGNIFSYRWIEAQSIELETSVDSVQWILDGLRLLVLADCDLMLYQHKLLSTAVSGKPALNAVKFSLSDEDAAWEVIWNTKLPARVKHIKFSPDGSLFATCGEDDPLVKIWYQQKESYSFSFIYIQHPAPVCGFEWRHSGRYMPRKFVQNTIITWCEDNTSRIWKEVPNRDASQSEFSLIEAAEVVSLEKQKRKKFSHKYFHLKKTKNRLVTKLSYMMTDKSKSPTRSPTSGTSSNNLVRSSTLADFALPASASTVVFCLAASINAENDCFLVPQMNSLSHSKRPFTVHWLNNKELIFTNGAERILAEALLNEQIDNVSAKVSQNGGEHSRGVSPGLILSSASSVDFVDHSVTEAGLMSKSSTPATVFPPDISHVDIVSAKDVLDIKLEVLLRQWSKSYDVLFSIHPVDGSLLTWTLEWLDDSWHQATVSFASRFPDAFPLTDASSLNLSMHTFNPNDPAYSEVLRKHVADVSSPESPVCADTTSLRERFNDLSQLNNILLLTSHENGSLNLWRLSMDENRFSTIINIIHESRMCGHRFHISQVVAHPVLPLLLTASQFTPDVESVTSAKESELILWKVAPVGNLCKSGGLRELARVTSNSPKAFTCLSWVPAILPSSILGTACNSPSSCFVASNNGKLCVYQAIVDARGLLSHLHSKWNRSRESSVSSLVDTTVNGDTPARNYHKYLKETFRVVSTQSTARPGCILYVGDVDSSEHSSSEIILLHIFEEELAVSNLEEKESKSPLPKPQKCNAEVSFYAKYLVVMVVRRQGQDHLTMWSLTMNAQRALPLTMEEQNNSSLTGKTTDGIFYPQADLICPSAAKLATHSEKVYDEALDFGQDIRIISCVASAGHLPSSSLQDLPAPYTLLLACSDDQIRFLRCVKGNLDNAVNESHSYKWEKWKMINDEVDSSLEMDGQIYSVSSAYSGRFAAAFRSAGAVHTDIIGKNLELAVFECESSGGVEWLREDTFNLEKCFVAPSSFSFKGDPSCSRTKKLSSSDVFEDLSEAEKMRELVRIDWVSTEDGSHILTVGIGHLISLFAQVSQNTAQHNIVMMKEHNEAGKRAPLRKSSSLAGASHASSRLVKWMCIRTLELQSADGLPPLPTAMSWVRDGLLIVGMNSEMRVYNQWNLSTKVQQPFAIGESRHHVTNRPPIKIGERKESIKSSLAPTAMNISRSHSMLDQLSRKQVDQVSSTKMIREIMSKVLSTAKIQDFNVQENVLDAVSEEGLFEASRLANPILPQYHPKQLIEMLNAGKIKRVKAVLLHVLRALKHRRVSVPNPLSRAASVRKMIRADSGSSRDNSMDPPMQRRSSVAQMTAMEDTNPDYDEIDTIAPLPLYALIAADNVENTYQRTENIEANTTQTYDTLFNDEASDDDLDEMLDDIVQNGGSQKTRPSRTRHSSGTSELVPANTNTTKVSSTFTNRHSRLLTELLTHTHLPGLSSVDQMHLLAIADTISHFSSSAILDKLTHANAALQSTTMASTLGDSSAAGYASATMGIETVDECGLRFLMAMKQHEYLLLCLPLKQRKHLKSRGISTAQLIWAFHSDTEMELLSAIPCCQKSQETWEELRSFGVAWWLKNTTTLRICVEKMAKSAFTQNQDPMDASLFYLALKKKNVLMHLFKTVSNTRMYDFFREDFTQDRWKRAALKNAFTLQSKQRYQHAAAFFLLGGSLKDAIQTILSRLNDLQLAMVILRLYETDPEKQSELITELLCREIFGCEMETIRKLQSTSEEANLVSMLPHASRDPFERSMAFWLMKEYAHAASTLVEEASKDNIMQTGGFTEYGTLSDIFNFYAYLRKHPLVVRRRLTNAGVDFKGTDQFLAFAKELEGRVTPSERRLYFRTASAHMASGCPLLALDVLSRLPNKISSFLPAVPTSASNLSSVNGTTHRNPLEHSNPSKAEDLDWAASPTHVIVNDDLELKWSDDEEEKEEEVTKEDEPRKDTKTFNKQSVKKSSLTVSDFISQHLRFIAVLRIMMDELATLASGFEIDGGQLRFELFKWLESECEILHEVCDFQPTVAVNSMFVDMTAADIDHRTSAAELSDAEKDLPLHESLRLDRIDLKQKLKNTIRRRNWLDSHQKLIRTLTSYCALHSAQNYRLTSIQMELLLLLLEVQRDAGQVRYVNEPVPDIHSFPLLVSSISSCRMFVLSPLHFVQNQCLDILLTIAELKEPPTLDSCLPKVYMLYNLCQGLSSCVYQSLSDIDHFCSHSSDSNDTGVLTYRVRLHSVRESEEVAIKSVPAKWPGVESLMALLAREKDDDAPNLTLLLAEFFIAITMSLFSYAFTIYDSKWIYRLCAHEMNENAYATVFGGAGEKKLRSSVPVRPPPPSRPAAPILTDSINQADDSAAIRAKLHAKVFGVESNAKPHSKPAQVSTQGASEQIISCWVPPKKHIVQFYAEKVETQPNSEDNDYDSDEDSCNGDSNTGSLDEDEEVSEPRPHDSPQSYAWLLLRLGSVIHIQHRIKEFLILAGFDMIDIPTVSPRIENIMKVINNWIVHLENRLETYPDGCPDNFLRNNSIEVTPGTVQSAPLLRKYRTLIEPGNTPFEYEERGVAPVKRLWCFLVKQEHLSAYFIKFIFGKTGTVGDSKEGQENTTLSSSSTTGVPAISDSVKIIQREHEPIIAFACNAARPGCIVVSTGREIQEISLEKVFEEKELSSAKQSTSSFLNNKVELDLAVHSLQRDTLRDNDDYQLITEGKGRVQGSSYLRKRPISGIRRLESHSTMPYYVSGSSDGSILLWEWGVDQPLFTARSAGQYAKVSKLAFAQNGNKFAAVDGDGLLCIWQASQCMALKKPFFSQKCHSKSAADVKFLGQTSSILVTAGHSTGDQNVVLWDTLMPQAKCMVHSFVGHQEGATCCVYMANTQSILSGGRHGDICIWDVRQRQLRSMLKAFDTGSVKCLGVDVNCDVLVAGSAEGDIKVWTADLAPQMLHILPGEHVSRGGFSLRQLPSSSLQGVQQVFIDDQLRLYSCGADNSLKFRTIPSLFS